MTTRDDVTAALEAKEIEMLLHTDRWLKEVGGRHSEHAEHRANCVRLAPILAAEVARLRGGISVASRAIANITAAIQHEVNNDTFERIMDTAILFSGPADTHGPAGTADEEA